MKKKKMNKSWAFFGGVMGFLVLLFAGIFWFPEKFAWLARKQSTPKTTPVETTGMKSRSAAPQGEEKPIREALQEGDVFRAIPSPAPGESSGDESPIIRRAETPTGEIVLFGKLTKLDGDNLTVDYTDGIQIVNLTPETTVFSVSTQGEQTKHDLDFLRSLQLPQIGSASYLAESGEALSVTIMQTD